MPGVVYGHITDIGIEEVVERMNERMSEINKTIFLFAKQTHDRAERDFGLETETETWVVSVSVSSLETPI